MICVWGKLSFLLREKFLHPFNCIVLLLKGVTSRNKKDFLKTLSLVKNKDPRIYDKKVELYKEGNR